MQKHILFVGRDARVLDALVRLFSDSEELGLHTASDATSAMQHLRQSPVDAVVADRMPGNDGTEELLLEIRKEFPSTKLLLLTEQDEREHRGVREALGSSLTIASKPWDAEELRSRILADLGHAIDHGHGELGELVTSGELSPGALEKAQRIREKMEDPVSLGELLVQMGEISEAALEKTQRIQRARLPLLEILRESGNLTAQGMETYWKAKTTNPQLDDYELLVGNQLVSEEDYLQAVSTKFDIPFTTPDISSIDEKLMTVTSFRYLIKNAVLPFKSENGRLLVIMARPLDQLLLLELERIFRSPIEPHCCTRDRIVETLRTLSRLRNESDGSRGTGLQYRVIDETPSAAEDGTEAVQIVDYLLLRAIQLGASDLHIEPMQNHMRVRVRVDGALQPLTELPKEAIARVTSRVKVLAGVDIAERRQHQDGKILVKAEGGEVDIRMSSYASVYGETIVLRLLERNRGLVPMAKLGFAPRPHSLIEDVILPCSSGLVLVSGPTGSGKTTTLYSFLRHHVNPTEKVITAEDPVEYVTEGVVQCSVNQISGPTFAASLKAMLRQDPDTIVVGEVRDRDTAELALEASLTGHKVYSTFHTEDSVTVAIRLLEMKIEPFLIASSVIGVLAQRLLRRLCDDCKTEARPTGKQLRFLSIARADIENEPLFEARGCPKCNGSGFRGRLGIHEVLLPNDDFKDAILERAPSRELRRLARQTSAFLSLQEDALLKARQGLTALSEVIANVPRDTACRTLADLRPIAGIRKST